MAIALDPRYVVELQPSRSRGPRPAATRSRVSFDAAAPSVVYRRRRVLAATVLAAVMVVSFTGGRAVLADRSAGVTSSSSAVVPADQMPAVYLVQPGDTMWAIAERFAGRVSIGAYVDALIAANGGASIQAGQQLVLP
jgi:hypothetical protein